MPPSAVMAAPAVAVSVPPINAPRAGTLASLWRTAREWMMPSLVRPLVSASAAANAARDSSFPIRSSASRANQVISASRSSRARTPTSAAPPTRASWRQANCRASRVAPEPRNAASWAASAGRTAS